MNKLNRSFSRRIGKSLSPLQRNLITNILPDYLLKAERLEGKKLVAEIGIGMAEHFINQAKNNPEYLHIGFEPYLNGVANALKLAELHNVENIALWPDDVDLAFANLPDHSLERLYILFPDPWPKAKQHKRRLVCPERLDFFAQKITAGGNFLFASDIADYSEAVVDLLSNHSAFSNISYGPTPHANYLQTKYHQKAEAAGRAAIFIQAKVNRCGVL